MGVYFNPTNEGFSEILNGKYVDKTGRICLINDRIDTSDNLICVSRPRRFGKSFATDMLCAYYSCACDSHVLFDSLEIANNESYKTHLNIYNVIYLDIAAAISGLRRKKRSIDSLVDDIKDNIREEIIYEYPELKDFLDTSDCIKKCVEITKRKIIIVIDEWDAVIREAKENKGAQHSYFQLLREWFQNRNFTPRVVAAAYMTGILPIKKVGSESAISVFEEFTMLDPGPFTRFTGFTEEEVFKLSEEYGRDSALIKKWYDGYHFESGSAIYNPYSVMQAVKSGNYSSHWRKTSAADNLITYINMDEEGLQADILKLLSGEHLRVNTRSFKNDFESFSSKDDVLTLLAHLGYLSYDKNSQTVRIPNEEVRQEFTDKENL